MPSWVSTPPFARSVDDAGDAAAERAADLWPHLNPEARTDTAWLLAEGPARPPRDGRRLVTFTFDDGPSPETTEPLLKILDRHRVIATFFLIGRYLEGPSARAEEARRCARQIAEAGHYVGNHALDHKLLTVLSHSAAIEQIDRSAAAIAQATGQHIFLFRPPYGATDPWLEGAFRERRLELVLWSVDAEDMKRSDPGEIATSIEQQLEYERGGLVLLHDVHWPSVKALERVLRWLEQSRWDTAQPERPGWEIVDLPAYLRATAESPQPFASRDALENSRRDPGAHKNNVVATLSHMKPTE
jgi:peptidoglycan/xylan/chitin deacetylase (PgdA/CDA1 family)